jgi:hypothetical protein
MRAGGDAIGRRGDVEDRQGRRPIRRSHALVIVPVPRIREPGAILFGDNGAAAHEQRN